MALHKTHIAVAGQGKYSSVERIHKHLAKHQKDAQHFLVGQETK